MSALLLAGAANAAAAVLPAPPDAPSGLAPFALSAAAAQPQPPWHFEGFPDNYDKLPTWFAIDDADGGRPTLRITTDNGYGNLVHPWHGPAPQALAWRWRLDRPLAHSDVARRDGDDSALKVCVLFDEPLERVPLLERTQLRIARAGYAGTLPAATVCYLWDGNRYPRGSSGANPYSARVRYLVLRGPQDPLGQWFDEQRDVRADFQRLFGTESPETPPLLAVAVGADADNTHGSSIAHLAALRWLP